MRPYRSSLPRTISGCSFETLRAAGFFNLFNSTFSNGTNFIGPNMTSLSNSTNESMLIQQWALAANVSLDSTNIEDLEL